MRAVSAPLEPTSESDWRDDPAARESEAEEEAEEEASLRGEKSLSPSAPLSAAEEWRSRLFQLRRRPEASLPVSEAA